MAATTDLQAPLDAVWDCQLPGMDGAGDPAEDARLAERLGRLALPVPSGDPPSPGRSATAIVDGGDVSALPRGASVVVDPVAGGWRMRLDVEETAFDVDIGYGDWRESSPLGRPVLAAGAWQDALFVADLYVINTPSRVRLVLDSGRAAATWNIVALVGPALLRQLRSPLMTRPDVG